MKKLFAALVLSSLGFSGVALASDGPTYLCRGTETFARVKPQVGIAQIYKINAVNPDYTMSCNENFSGPGPWLDCQEPTGRMFVVQRDLSAVYYGRNRNHQMTCQHTGWSAD